MVVRLDAVQLAEYGIAVQRSRRSTASMGARATSHIRRNDHRDSSMFNCGTEPDVQKVFPFSCAEERRDLGILPWG
jgi:hypothetical protein